MDLVRLSQRVALFTGLSKRAQMADDRAEPWLYCRNQTLMRVGERGELCLLLTEGAVRVSLGGISGEGDRAWHGLRG